MAFTPYDGKLALWHWKGSSVAEQTIDEFARTLKQWAPHVKQVFVKTSDGSDWMGKYDSGELAINGSDDIARWVQVLESHGLEFHAWCVPKGADIIAEADIIIAASSVEGVRSMILDIEPYPGFWEVGRTPIKPFMTRIRRGVGGKFHIGMSVDPRVHHYARIFPQDWRPFVNSIHPQAYWASFERDLEEVLDEVYEVWGNYGLPLIPVLQGNAQPDEMMQAREYALNFHNAPALSWWRFGVIGPAQFPVINIPIKAIEEPEPEDPPEGGRYGQEIVVRPQDPGFKAGSHVGQSVDDLMRSFRGTWGWDSRYAETRNQSSAVWALWDPNLTQSGWYEVGVFVPARHATTSNARYKLHGVIGQQSELQISIDQAAYHNLWVPLGLFQFDANNARSGVVFLNDLTYETDREIAFDAIRYRQIIGRNVAGNAFLADGYDAPIGTRDERADTKVWPGHWFDATGYAVRYYRGTPQEAYHTGVDLNLNRPYWDADAHAPVYAAASGIVTFAGRLAGWGPTVVIRHDPLLSNGQVMYGRYAHVQKIRVQVGDRVQRGQQIANVGNAEGAFPYHLHFDLSPTDILDKAPWDWPRLDINLLRKNYVDPRAFIEENRPPEA